MMDNTRDVIVSEPCKELVGGGANAKYVKECTELYLAGKGIEKLRGFEPFVNLESLWLNSNKLRKINNLDNNFRIKALYAHDNLICTLKGSLLKFKFLETLDLANNQLRDLDKQLQVLEKFHFLKQLNLTGNPCVEEPDYRLTMIHRLPQLVLLDQHAILDSERRKAAALIGGNVQALTVAFMQRVPAYDPAWDAKVSERSVLEQQLAKEANTIRDIKAAKAYDAETALFKNNPYPDIPRSTTLPPNAGTRRAHQMMAEGGAGRLRGGLAMKGTKPPPLAFQPGWRRSNPGHAHDCDDDEDHMVKSCRSLQQAASTIGWQSVKSMATAFSHCATDISAGSGSKHGRWKKPEPDIVSPHVPKDILIMSSLSPGTSDLIAAGTRTTSIFHSQGPIQFEQQKYEEFVKQRSCGREKWSMSYKRAEI